MDRGKEMAEKNILNARTLLDKRIEQFCESHNLLMTNIHARRKKKLQDSIKTKNGPGQNELILMSDPEGDFSKDDDLDDLL